MCGIPPGVSLFPILTSEHPVRTTRWQVVPLDDVPKVRVRVCSDRGAGMHSQSFISLFLKAPVLSKAGTRHGRHKI
jgi:hypothetical protein